MNNLDIKLIIFHSTLKEIDVKMIVSYGRESFACVTFINNYCKIQVI